jgi:hypothetical protein
VLKAGRPRRDPRDHEARGAAEALLQLWFDVLIPLAGKILPWWEGLHVSAGERAPLPRPGRAGRADARPRLR